MPRTIIAFVTMCVTFAAFAADKQRLTIDTPRGISQTIYYFAAPTPRANLLLFEGGPGFPGGFMDIALDYFVEAGFAVASVGVPSDLRNSGGMTLTHRGSSRHVTDVDATIKWMLEKYPGLPTWLVGISLGTHSVASVALHTKEQVNGIVLLSSHTDAQNSVCQYSLGSIKVPAFVGAHRQDRCGSTPPGGAQALMGDLRNAPRKQLAMFEGGKNIGKDPCKPQTYHTFNLMEEQVIGAIAKFIDQKE